MTAPSSRTSAILNRTLPTQRNGEDRLRFHLYQIRYAPAYFTDNTDYLSEPCLLLGKPLSSALRASAVGREVLETTRARYLEHIQRKIVSLLEWSAARGAQLVVFPEYSVPSESLGAVAGIAMASGMTVVAASHRVRIGSSSNSVAPGVLISDYRTFAGKACAPVFAADGCIDVAIKKFRSQWEPDLQTTGGRIARLRLGTARPLQAAILLCIDGLHAEALGQLWERREDSPHIIVCPSLTPRSDVFGSLGPLAAANGALFLFVNSADYGGTQCAYPDSWESRLSGPSLLQGPLGRGIEAVLEFDVNPNALTIKEPAVGCEAPGAFPAPYPIAYLDQAPWLEGFQDMAAEVKAQLCKGEINEATEWLDLFLTEKAATIPPLMRRNLEHARNCILPAFTGEMNALETALGVAVIRGTSDTRGIWANATRSTLNVLGDLIRNPELDVEPSILQAIAALKEVARSLPSPAAKRSGDSDADDRAPGAPRPPVVLPDGDELISSFQDRGDILDEFRTYMGSVESRVILVTGALGIGKTSLVDVFLRKIMTDWKVRRVPVVEGSSSAALVSTLGSSVGCDFDINALSAASPAVFRRRVRDVMARLFEHPRYVTIIDDLGNIVAGRLPLDFKRLEILMEEAAQPDGFRGGRVIIICSALMPRGWINRQGVRHVHLAPLPDRYVYRIIEHQLRRSQVLDGEAPPEISQEVIDLVGGHPLSALYCAEALKDDCTSPATKKGLERIGSSVAAELLKHVRLSPAEGQLLQRLSVFRLPAHVDGLRALGFPIEQLEILAERCVVASDGRTVGMHEAARRFFYNQMHNGQTRAESHATAVEYYRPIHERRMADSIWDPLTTVELCHHLARTGRHMEAADLGVAVVEELKQTARALYRKERRYDEALALFRLVAELAPSDVQALAYVGRCFARIHQWGDSDEAFSKAVAAAARQRERLWWIYRDWGHIKARFGFYEDATKHFDEAEACGVDDVSIIASRAYIRWRQGDTKGALEQFARAHEANPDHQYTLKYYAELLDDVGDHRYATALRQELAMLQAREPGEVPNESDMEDDFSDL